MNPDVEPPAVLNSAKAVLSASARMLQEAGYAGYAERIIRQATRTTDLPVVVFVGESGKGKSSLVDMLSPGLPREALEQDFQGIYRLVLPAAEGTEDAVAWVYPDGTRHKNLSPQVSPIGVQMRTTSSLLGDVILLDAPSTGGLTGSQSQLNLKILETASVAVFVTDAGAVLSRAELLYLRQCSSEVETLGLVVTKSDLYPDSWRDVARGNADLLKSQIPRFAGSYVVPVSTAAAKVARETRDSTLKDTLWASSGINQLVQVLKRDLARAGNAPIANALRMARTGLETRRQTLLGQLAVVDVAPDVRARMESEQQRLTALQEEQQRWSLDLERDLGELRANVMRGAAAKLDAWSTQWRNRIQSVKGLRDEKATEKLTNEIFAQLQTVRAEVVADAEEQLQRLTHAVFRGVSLPAVLHEVLTTSVHPTHEHQLGSGRKGPGVDPGLVMSILRGSSMGGAVAGLAGVGGGPATAIALLGAGGWFAVTRLYRQNMVEKTRLLAEIPRLAQAERAVIGDHLENRMRRLKPELVVSYRTQLQESLAGVQQLIHESQQQLQLSAQSARQRTDALQRELEAVGEQLSSIDDALEKMRLL